MQSQSKGKSLTCLSSITGYKLGPQPKCELWLLACDERGGGCSPGLAPGLAPGALGSLRVGKLGPWRDQASVAAPRHSEKWG